MTKNLPKIISELYSIDWLEHLFDNFNLDHLNTPKFKFRQAEYSHRHELDQYDFKTYQGKDINIQLSEYFKSFSLTIGTNSTSIFDNIEEYCTNENFTQEKSFRIKGKREKTYWYIGDKLVTYAIIGKMTSTYTRIVIWHQTIDKTPKNNIKFELTLNGEFHISKTKKVTKFYDYSDCSPEELESINKWKNVKLSIELQKIQARMENWIDNLYECSVDEPTKRIRAIYLSEEKMQKIQSVIDAFKTKNLILTGEFKMYEDYTAILNEIHSVKITDDNIKG